MPFICFYTFYKEADKKIPVTVGYDSSPSIRLVLADHAGFQFIHSGNWWTIAPEKRVRETVFERQIALANEHTAGFMSMNVQPGNNPMYWIEQEQDESHMKICLENANFAGEELRARGIKIPLYCALQPSNVTMAEKWFQRAINAGHVHLCMGVSEFLKAPKYRNEGIRRIMQITNKVKRLLGKSHGFFHLSGLTSYNLLPIVAALGATSTDGSTPVQSALAYGTVFFHGSGKGMQANAIWEKKADLDWACPCNTCKGKQKDEIFRSFTEPKARVIHNLNIWEILIGEINHHVLQDPSTWYEHAKKNLSAVTKKTWDYAINLIEKE